MKIRYLIFLMCMVASSWFTAGAQFSGHGILEDYFEKVRIGEAYKLPPVGDIPVTPRTIETIIPYLSDTLPRVQLEGCRLLHLVFRGAVDSLNRQKVLTLLCKTAAGLPPPKSRVCLGWLTGYRAGDFTNEACYYLVQVARQKNSAFSMAVKLAAFAGSTEIRYLARGFQRDTMLMPRDRFAASLALARMGEKKAIKSILQWVRTLPVGDDLVHEIVPGLVYTRQPEIYDFLYDIILAEEKNCYSVNPNSTGKIPCAYEVIHFLATGIENFPVTGDNLYTEAVLRETREWIMENKSRAIINRSTY
ncbi:MAG: hypothetical protein ACOCXW_02380 [Bacteroidota bacterium]